MRSLWETLKRFLTSEEVPRWFGLSIVLICLIGLGLVAHFGVVQARQESAEYFWHSSRYAVRMLAKRLSTLEGSPPEADADSKLVASYQRELRDFAANVPTRSLRVVGTCGTASSSGTCVLASTNPDEISAPVSEPQAPARGDDQEAPGMFFRLPLTMQHRRSIPSKREAVSDQHSAFSQSPPAERRPLIADSSSIGLYLEARLPPDPFRGPSLAEQARTLTVVLVVLGALFVVYRCLRGQMRSVSRIAGQLQTTRGRLEENLESLRIGDALDSVTTAWNELIDLTKHLSQTVERSEANKELSQALHTYGSGALAEALGNIPDGIMYITDEVRFEYVNATACRLFGWSAQDVRSVGNAGLPEAQAEGVGAKVLDLLHGALQSDGSYEARSEVLETDDADGRDNNHSSYRVRVIPLSRSQRPGECVVVIRDVSQQVRAERAREEFITHVTHELRTPLTNIRAYAETLSSGMFDDPSLITECYNVITKETRRLSRLIDDILNVSQLEVGTIELHLDQVDLKTVLSEGIRDVRGLADEKNIDLQLVLPAKLETIRADRDKLAVVVNNLLGNAIKYTLPNGNVVLGCQCTTDEVVITVKDNGIGIDPPDQGRVFEKFQRLSDPEVQSEPGTGIGLYTAREIVRRHHGDIELISEKGEGSTFLVRLPRQQTRATTLTTSEAGRAD